MKGEVGDWQSKMPLEYSSAFEPALNKTTGSEAQGKQVGQAATGDEQRGLEASCGICYW